MSEKNEEARNMLYIPANITTRFEIMRGFGWRELAVTSVATAISILIGVTLSGLLDWSVLRVIVFIGLTGFATGGIVRKDNFNRSMVDLTRQYVRFGHTQQKFKYVYKSKYKQ